MTLFERLTRRAQENRRRLVLPESLEPRTLQAANRVIASSIADVTFIGKRDAVLAKAFELGLPEIEKARFVDPEDTEYTEPYAELFKKLREKKGVTIDQAREQVRNPLYLGCLMIKRGDADAMVAGALSPTSHVLRAAFQVLKTKPGISVVSGAFIMLLPVRRRRHARVRRLRRRARPDGRGARPDSYRDRQDNAQHRGPRAPRGDVQFLDQGQRVARARRQGDRGHAPGA